MTIKTLTRTLSVTPQVQADDVPELAARGFRSIVCNRPDGEGPDQPSFAEIEAACRQCGLAAAYCPAVSGDVTDKDAHAFGELLESLPAPTAAYCRTGMRPATLWTLAGAGRGPACPNTVHLGACMLTTYATLVVGLRERRRTL